MRRYRGSGTDRGAGRDRRRLGALCIAAIAVVLALSAHGQNAASQAVIDPLPFYWERGDHVPTPDFSSINGINFLTESDYPPFNYRDARGDLVGFNVDIAKALCAALRVSCRIASREWDALVPALEDHSADAIIASMAITEENRRRVDFTFPYYRSPARFAVRKQDRLDVALPEALAGSRIAVRAGTAHEAYLNDFFADAEVLAFDTHEQAREALRTGDVDALFADGTALVFWINGTASRDCCRLAEGAYTETRYFGQGAGIAVRRGDQTLIDALNYGLDRIKVSGTYDRIFRKHFPLDLY